MTEIPQLQPKHCSERCAPRGIHDAHEWLYLEDGERHGAWCPGTPGSVSADPYDMAVDEVHENLAAIALHLDRTVEGVASMFTQVIGALDARLAQLREANDPDFADRPTRLIEAAPVVYPERWINVYVDGTGCDWRNEREADVEQGPARIGVIHLHPDGTLEMEQP